MSLLSFQLVLVFVVTAVLLMALRRPALNAGLKDCPGGRKTHVCSVPLIGGLAIFVGFSAGAALLDSALVEYMPLFAGMLLLLFTGVLDDLGDLSPRVKLGMQFAVALVMAVFGGQAVTSLGPMFWPGQELELGWLAVPFTVLCVIGLVNAVNMIDGVDGLAGGLTAVSLGWMVAATAVAGMGRPMALIALLLAAVLAFLVFNMRNPWRKRASCFLGDSGSMVLGFTLAWFAVELGEGAEPALAPVAVAWLLALPVMDTVSLMARRVLKGHSPFRPDRQHLHHILERTGFSVQQSVLLLVAVHALFGGIGVMGSWLAVPDHWLTLGLLLVVGLYLILSIRAWRITRFMRRHLHHQGPGRS